jgi:8-oxo-dGTP pyrophosphatase MutT (NUDIX family)
MPRATLPPIALDGTQVLDAWIVSALVFVPDGRYLLQLRDDKPGLPMRDHWGLFGGHVEPGEDGDTAIRREILEELGHVAGACEWFHEAIHAYPRRERRVLRRTYYLMPVTDAEVARMRLGEGAAMRLFTLAELLALPRIVPWDLAAIVMHARARQTFEA